MGAPRGVGGGREPAPRRGNSGESRRGGAIRSVLGAKPLGKCASSPARILMRASERKHLERQGIMARNRSWVSSLPMAAIIFGLWGLWPGASRTEAGEGFLRGDVDGSLRLEITDAIRIFQFLFLGGGGARSLQDRGG